MLLAHIEHQDPGIAPKALYGSEGVWTARQSSPDNFCRQFLRAADFEGINGLTTTIRGQRYQGIARMAR